jgi:hypothetical protein
MGFTAPPHPPIRTAEVAKRTSHSEDRTASRLLSASVIASLVAIACLMWFAAAAIAEVIGAGPDETIQQAYGPLAQQKTYSGAFEQPGDVDYLAFDVAAAGETLRFTLANTMQSCSSPDQDYCPVYATLMDASNQQVGGDTSGAGTVAIVGDSETFDWTFAQAGTYYLLMESNDNLPAGQPTYSVTIGPPPGTGSGRTSPGSGAAKRPIVKSIVVAPRQRGSVVSAKLVLGTPATRLAARLYVLRSRGRRSYVAGVVRRHVGPGTVRLSLALPASDRHALKVRHHILLLLDLTITAASGRHAEYERRVTLSG